MAFGKNITMTVTVGAGDTIPTTMQSSVTVEDITFNFDAAYPVGMYTDGMPFVVGNSVGFLDPTPAIQNPDVDGNISSGVMINVARKNTAVQSFDSYFSGFDGGLMATFPQTLGPKDCVYKVITASLAESGALKRGGGFKKHAWIHVVSEAPPKWEFSPPSVWPDSDKANRPSRTVDVDALVATLPSYSTAGHTDIVAWSELKPEMSRPNGAYPLANSTAGNGYEYIAPLLYCTQTYGGVIERYISHTLTGLISDAWSVQDKTEAMIRMLHLGCQWGETIGRVGETVGVTIDGGHHQFAFGVEVLWLYATDQLDRYSTWFPKLSGNILGQIAYRDAAWLAVHAVPHDEPDQAHPWRRRPITSVSDSTVGNVADIGVNSYRGGSGGLQYDGTKFHVDGLILTRESDGATALITVGTQDAPVQNEDTPQVLTIDAQPNPPFAVDDVIYFESPWTLTDGFPAWCISSAATQPWVWSPAKDYPYRELNHPAGQHMFLTALGLHHSIADAGRDYTENCMTGTYPTASIVFPGASSAMPGSGKAWVLEMWEDHWTTIKATTQLTF